MDIPPELLAKRNWVLWRDEEGRKMPYQPNGRPAKSNDPTTWVDFSTALARSSGYTGLGYVFDGPEFGIDLDGCTDDAGQVQSWAQQILVMFPTYAELSPSGHGVKLFGLGTFDGPGRKKLIDAAQCCNKKPGIEVYCRGRYFTFTGRRLKPHPLALRDCQQSLNDLLAMHWPFPQLPAPLPPLPPLPADVIGRARAYLASIEPAISGQHGHDATFRAACKLVLGFGLTPDQAYPLLAEWNQACNPPWNEYNLRRKLAQADAQPGPRGFLLDDRAAESPGVDISAIVHQKQRPAPGEIIVAPVTPTLPDPIDPADDIPDPPAPLPLTPDTMPGLIGEIVRHNLATALYPQPELALAGAIALMATITGRKIQDPQDTRTNVYVLGLAPSGSGKEHARKINKELLLRAGAPKMLGPERIGSSAGLARCVRDNPAILFQLDEISRLLETTKSSKSAHLFNVPSILLQLYGSSNCLWIGDAYAKAEQTPVINQPHCVIYGTSVPGPFWAAMTHENVTDGLLGRFLPFESGYVDMQTPQNGEPPQALVENVRLWTEYKAAGNLTAENPVPTTFQHSSDAYDRFAGHAADIVRRRKTEDASRGAMWSRTIGTTAKLALIFAASDATLPLPSQPTIGLPHVNAAIRISNWATRRMLRMVFEHVGGNDYERQGKRILRMLLTPLTQNQLTRKTQDLKPREREDIIRTLVQAGLVEIVDEKTAGRTRRVIRQVRPTFPRQSPSDEGLDGTVTKAP